jgi:hypothetical protein
MSSRLAEALQSGRTVRPLVRPTRSQREIDLLPPYGDPEVHLLGELATYVAVGATVTTLLDRFSP